MDRQVREIDREQLHIHLSVLVLREAVRHWLKTGELIGPIKERKRSDEYAKLRTG